MVSGITSSIGPAAPPYADITTLAVDNACTFSGAITFSSTVTFTGSMTFGDAAADTLTVTGTATFAAATQFNNTVTVGESDTGYDVQFFGATAGKYMLWDESADTLILEGTLEMADDEVLAFGDSAEATIEYDEDGGDSLNINGPTAGIWFNGLGGAIAANMLIFGAGTSASPATTSTADKSFMEFRTQTTATSGDSRCLYMRHNLNGAGVSGEALRAFGKITAATATCRGAHISLDVGTGGSCSGLGAGVDSQVLVLNAALSGGTYTAQNIEWYAAGSSTDISGVTQSSFIRCVLGGDATGAANIEDNANLLVVTGGSNASGNIVGAAGNEPTWTGNTYLVRCNLNGQAAFLVAVKV